MIFLFITVMGVVTWWVTPEDKWLPSARLGKVHLLEEELNSANHAGPAKVVPASSA